MMLEESNCTSFLTAIRIKHMKRLVLFASILLSSCNSVYAQTSESPAPPALPELLGAKTGDIKSYYAEVKETGVYHKPLESRVWFEGANRMTVQWLKPEEFAGAMSTIDAKAWKMTFPKTRQALVFRNLPLLKDLHKPAFMMDLKKVTVELGAKQEFLKSPAQKVTFRTLGNASYINEGSWIMSESFTIPLSTEWVAPAYAREFTRVDFNTREVPQKPTQLMPSYLETFEWDFLDRPITRLEFEEEIKRNYQLPETFPFFSRIRIVRQKGAVPSIAALYSSGERHVIVALHAKPVTSNLPPNWGIPFKTASHKVELIPGLTMPIVTFEIDKIRYYFTGNIPVNELIKMADQLEPKVVPAKTK